MPPGDPCTVFRVGEGEYALPGRVVLGCGPRPVLHPAPLAAREVAGVAEVGGRLVPYLRGDLLLGEAREEDRARLSLLVGVGSRPQVGLLVDALEGVHLASACDGESPEECHVEAIGRRVRWLGLDRLQIPMGLPASTSRPDEPALGSIVSAPPAEPARLVVRSGGRLWAIEPESVGPYLPRARIVTLATGPDRMVGFCRFGRRRIPVVAPEVPAEGAAPEDGALVVRIEDYLYALPIEKIEGFRRGGEEASLEPARSPDPEELRHMNRIRKLKNWRLTRPLARPSVRPGRLHLVCRAGGRGFAVEGARVVRVLEPRPVTSAPTASGRVAGVVEIDGRPVPALDVARFFRGGGAPVEVERPALLVEGADEPWVLRIDAVEELRSVCEVDLLEVEEPAPGLHLCYTAGFLRSREGEELLPVLDVEAIVKRMAAERRRSSR